MCVYYCFQTGEGWSFHNDEVRYGAVGLHKMKVASLRNGRDGELVIVSRDLRYCVAATPVVSTLQAALDDWSHYLPRLEELSAPLNRQDIEGARPFDSRLASAPLPRAYQWLDGSVYLNHAQLLRKMRNADMPGDANTVPLMYQGGSDRFNGPTADILAETEDWGRDFEAELAVFTRSSAMVVDRFCACSSKVTVAKAIVPSLPTCVVPSGP